MQKLIIIGLAVFLSASISAWGYSQTFLLDNKSVGASGSDSLLTPDFTFQAIDTDKTYNLRDFRGKIILINFCSSSIIPCLYEFPRLINMAARHPDDFVLIMISADNDTSKAYNYAKGFCIRHNDLYGEKSRKLFPDKNNIYISWDNNNKAIQNLLGVASYPESVLFTPELAVGERIKGGISDDKMQEIENILQ